MKDWAVAFDASVIADEETTFSHNFNWLLLHLTSDLEIDGCMINIPDYALFKNGKVEHYIYTNENGRVQTQKNSKKIDLWELRLKMA